MSIISLIFTLLIVGVLLWAVETLIPLDDKIRRIIQVVVVLAVLFYVASAFGLLGGTPLRLR